MKYARTTHFKRDYKKLPDDHKGQFQTVVPQFHEAAVAAAAGDANPWPNAMRVKPVQGASGIWEMTWSMDNPDGRATWGWIKIDGEAGILWRRVGNHRVLDNP